VIKGLRKYGPSKEHRPNPIVEMGLFMDRDGIPLSMCITLYNELMGKFTTHFPF
jgi:hypothetical protein